MTTEDLENTLHICYNEADKLNDRFYSVGDTYHRNLFDTVRNKIIHGRFDSYCEIECDNVKKDFIILRKGANDACDIYSIKQDKMYYTDARTLLNHTFDKITIFCVRITASYDNSYIFRDDTGELVAEIKNTTLFETESTLKNSIMAFNGKYNNESGLFFLLNDYSITSMEAACKHNKPIEWDD